MYAGTKATTGSIEVSVRVNGVDQPLYRNREGKLFVAGKAGQPYTLHVRNLQAIRVEVINTVDGRHTLKDEPGDSRQNRGLVFRAHSEGAFTGWRVNDDETREFIFGSPDRSVAAQATGSTSKSNVGVIGFATWREQPPVWAFNATTPVAGGSFSASAAASARPDAGEAGPEMVSPRGLGTGIGERQTDHVGRTSFTRVMGSPDILVIGYDTYESLVDMGIVTAREPSAFPGSETGYASYA